MNKNDILVKKVKLLKALGQIDSYKELSEMLDIKPKSMYNWLRKEYQFSEEKLSLLSSIVNDLWIPIE